MTKTALITGSTSGIGLGIAKRLAQDGFNIVMNGFGAPADIDAAQQQIKTLGAKIMYDGADMTKPDQIEAMIKKARDTFGGIDVLVNNAGIQHVCAIEDFPPEKWDTIIAINLTAAFHTSRLCVPYMKKQKWGRIINIASAHALVASPFKAAYVAAKHGIAGLTKVLGVELGEDGITANAICPGYVKTPLVENQVAATANARGISEEAVVRDVLLGEQPTKTFVGISEVADLASYLAGDSAKSITGSCIAIDGGWTAH